MAETTEAEENLIKAIVDFAVAVEGPAVATDILVNEFAVVVQWQHVRHQGEHEYSVYGSDRMPIHRTLGLLRMASSNIESGHT